MSTITVRTSRTIPATAEAVYAFLRDYRKRPQILTPNFLDYAVEEGGEGAGTVIRYRLKAARRERSYRMRVDEPAPGRALRESDSGSSLITTWTLTPSTDGQQTGVTLGSAWQGGSGIGGFMERTFAPMGLRRIYSAMLDRLEQAVARGT
jgi:hypothetical protein